MESIFFTGKDENVLITAALLDGQKVYVNAGLRCNLFSQISYNGKTLKLRGNQHRSDSWEPFY